METLERFGNFSSSEIWKLTTLSRDKKEFGAPAKTYISEKQMEIRLGRGLTVGHNAKETNWGTFLERRAFDLLPLSYKLQSTKRLAHPAISHWVGIPDVIIKDGEDVVVGDIKCPWTLKGFCSGVDTFGDAEIFKAEYPEYYWQLVSNCILVGSNKAEIIYYVPYQKELVDIREMAEQYDGDQNKIAFINWASDNDLPYLIEGKHYKNINTFRFEVPQSDIDFLTECVKKAVELLKS